MHFNLQPSLENDLVRLRPLQEDDLEPLYEVAKDPLIWEQHPCSDRYQRDVFEAFFQESLSSRGALIVMEKEKNKVIGSSRFKKIQGVMTATEIGWSFLAREYWGGKYNKAVKSLMVEYLFGHNQAVIFYIDEGNIRSRKAVEKLGGKILESPEFKNLLRGDRPDLIYILNRQDWRKNE